MIQFTCPSCKSGCSVDDKYKGRKLRCPKCSARVLHRDGDRVELLTAGKDLPPKPAPAPAPGSTDPTQPLSDITPVATAIIPHSVGELVNASESKQNLYIGAALLGFFAIVGVILGLVLNVKLLVVAPIAVVLVAVGIYLWLHTQKLQKRLDRTKK